MGVVLPFVPLISAGLGVAGAVSSAMANARASRARSDIARRNKEIALDNSERAIESGGDNARKQDIITSSLIGRQEAVQSASGLSVAGSSFTLTRQHAKRLAAQDRANIVEGAQLEALNYINAAETQATEALFRNQEASSSMAAGWLNATGAVLNQIPNMYNYGTLNAMRGY